MFSTVSHKLEAILVTDTSDLGYDATERRSVNSYRRFWISDLRSLDWTVAEYGGATILRNVGNYQLTLSHFFYGSTALYGPGPPRFVEVSWSHIWDTPQSVGLLWTRDQLVAETSTWQHTTLTRDKHPCPGGIRTHDPSKRAAEDPRLRLHGHWDRLTLSHILDQLFPSVLRELQGIRDQFPDDPWIHLSNAYFEVYLLFNYTNNVLLKTIGKIL
jgi:hypothetical protein